MNFFQHKAPLRRRGPGGGLLGGARRWLAPLLAVAAAGCAVENPAEPFAAVDRAAFTCAVQPILARQCSMPACHGNPERRLRVLAPGRMRLAGELAKAEALQPPDQVEAGLHPPLTEVELAYNFAQARSMIAPGERVDDCPLLNRPLAVAAGGIYHVAGGDVFPGVTDTEYVTLKRWIQGAGAELCP